ncbi:MAG: hypothetical protein CV081_10790 [Nitrospira sp. LK265]|nr:hypothetical protein [Nitrospira sp. LK265]
MSQIIPFQGMLYDQTLVGSIRDVVAPPYDIIDVEGQKRLHDRHPHNIIRMELGLDQTGDSLVHNRYTRAATTLQTWLNEGILKRDAQPAVYFHTIEYAPPYSASDAHKKVLRGFLALAKLETLDSGHIYPHENTRAAAKTDRLNLIEACRSNFSPIWSLYSDPLGAIIQLLETAVKGKPARYDFRDDAGCRECLWVVTDQTILQQVTDAMRSKPLFIADGHHRYETALNYQKLRRQQAGPLAGLQPYDSVLMLLTPLEDPGLTVLPTHRVRADGIADTPSCDHPLTLLRPDQDGTGRHVRVSGIPLQPIHARASAVTVLDLLADGRKKRPGVRTDATGR